MNNHDPDPVTITDSQSYGFDLSHEGGPRTPGLHLSGILRRLAFSHHLWDSDPDEIPLYDLIRTTPPEHAGKLSSLVRIAVGHAWEKWYMGKMPKIIHQPGEFVLDGVICTPDGLEPDDHGTMILHEVKVSWSSSRTPLTEKVKLYWLWEIMGYLAAISFAFGEQCTRAVLHPLYVNGDYKRDKGSGPKCVPLELEFSWEEIMTNWQVILNNREGTEEERGQ